MSAAVWTTLLFGTLGGVANCILVIGGFAMPRRIERAENQKVLDVGFLGPLILGAIVALATYLLGAAALPELNRDGIALISGLGGGNLLNSLLQKQEATTMKTQLAELQKSVTESLKGGHDVQQ